MSKTGERAILMELNDLRIGNVLSYDGQLVHVTTLSMNIDDEYQEIIGFCKVGESSNEIADWNRALCDKLKPTPLTHEILEKAGFEKNGDDYRKFDFILNCWRGSKWIILNNHGKELYPSMPLIKYLHQLQNLYFALTAKELTLKLSLPISDNQQLQKP